jgi:hypothetical protein
MALPLHINLPLNTIALTLAPSVECPHYYYCRLLAEYKPVN